MRLRDRKALITGASRGIGKAIALAYAREGAVVGITARRLDSLEETAAQVEAIGRRAYCMEWDVRDVSLVDAKLGEVKENLGGLDIVVNNAGVRRLPADHANPSPEAEWDYVIDINLKAVYFICQSVAKLMQEQKSGVIINIASDAGMRGAPNPYGISKWGLIGYTKGLAKRMAPHGVRVNAIAPGPVATEMMDCPDGVPKEAPQLPLGRFALPDEIAVVAVFLACDDSAGVIGHAVVVNTANT